MKNNDVFCIDILSDIEERIENYELKLKEAYIKLEAFEEEYSDISTHGVLYFRRYTKFYDTTLMYERIISELKDLYYKIKYKEF